VGSDIVISRAIIRDNLEGHPPQRMMSLVTMIFGVAPLVVVDALCSARRAHERAGVVQKPHPT
jgi:hypothetical protein